MHQTPHVVMLPSPGMGHLIPLIELSKRLVATHDFTVTFLIPTDGPPSKAQMEVVQSLPPAMQSVFLPPVSFDDVPEGAKIETLITLTVARSLPAVRRELESLSSAKKVVALVVDLFATHGLDVAKEFGISPFIFFPSTAMVLSFFLHLPQLDESTSCDFKDLPGPVQIPGCIPILGKDLLNPVQDKRSDEYKWVLFHARRYKQLAEGIMVNSFAELEGGAIKALQKAEPGKPQVYPVGPLVKMETSSGPDGTCLKWLDDQPLGSVIFVSFGSGGTLTHEQIIELALGLEMSGQRFLWVVRTPNKVANSSYFTVHSQNDPLSFLPQGFLERTKGKGLVVPNWAPQAQILSHGSTGGFLSHCGWNSTLESVVNGVPLIAWPLYAEQKMNAVSLTEDVKVAVRPKFSENGLAEREEIARLVIGLMEGEEGKRLRYRMKDLKHAAANALSENGSSTKALASVAEKWKNSLVVKSQ